ncbi:DNA (cytosine-5-)-methyltransferase [Mycoplasma sp. CSL7503-lung]|uniref:DNA (cytosine-5-)-methyltransferase n=1 Tax=Mycoplasma sp. CSL7503-lung TaxID=536372 RepID=UPI0021D01DFF|nr:DNA (cytosine-5-)-methyltransferase [Mycoplasma sp. CSL7503-lung]MCU4706810.1 DNA (cytosine-5-)-methyltransferase [Mycoplasma sp. CSL7503-lung]
MSKIKFMDFCSGIGGGRLGLEKNGLVCVGHSEIDKNPDKTYNLFFGDYNNYGDLMKINVNELPDFDFMIGGFPCQTFSIAGKREGFNDYRGMIIYGLINILKIKNIKYFLFENVKGLISHDKGNTFKIIQNELNNAGYNVYSKILNSSHFSVPQKRERIYLVGIKKEIDNNKFKFPTGEPLKYNFSDFIDDGNSHVFDIYSPTFQKYLNNKYNKGKYTTEDILKLNDVVIDTRQSDIRIYQKIFPTLRTGRHGLLYVKNGVVKKLSGYESLLLQGFPKKLSEKIKDNEDFKDNKILSQAGNAMTVTVIEEIVKNIIDSLDL